LCFSACKLNLPLVPSQDDVLKDNKRCYDNILSECGITDPLQIYSGWLYNKILQINNVNKTSKRLKNDVDIENHRIIQRERPLTTRILL
jgi:hypothetical protein